MPLPLSLLLLPKLCGTSYHLAIRAFDSDGDDGHGHGLYDWCLNGNGAGCGSHYDCPYPRAGEYTSAGNGWGSGQNRQPVRAGSIGNGYGFGEGGGGLYDGDGESRLWW